MALQFEKATPQEMAQVTKPPLQFSAATAQDMQQAMPLSQQAVGGMGLNSEFAGASNDAEKQSVLAQKVGKGNFFKHKGTYYIAPQGLKKLGVKSNKAQPVRPGFWANIVSDLPQLAGMTEGSIIGGALGGALGSPVGPEGTAAGAMLGSYVGGALGEGSQDVGKALTGQFHQSPGEVVHNVAQAGNAGLVGEAGGRVVSDVAGDVFLRPYQGGPIGKLFGRSEAKTNAEVGGLLEKGYRPPIHQANPHAKIAAIEQGFSNRIFGNPAEKLNMRAAKQDIMGVLKQADPNARASLPEVLNSEVSQQGNEALIGKAQDYLTTHQMTADQSFGVAKMHLDNAFSGLKKEINANPDIAHEAVSSGLIGARKVFDVQSGSLYSKVDALVGDKTIVPTDALKHQAAQVLDEMPKDRAGNPVFSDRQVLQSLKALRKLPNKISVSDAQRIRSQLHTYALTSDLVPGIDTHQFAQLATAANTSIHSATGDMDKAAISALDKADNFYSTGIKKFDQTMVSALVKDAGTRGAVNPEKTARYIIGGNNVHAARNVKSLISPENWKAVKAQDFADMVNASKDPLTGDVQATKLAKQIDSRGPMMDLVYGKSASQIKEYAKQLAAFNGKIDPETLKSGDFSNALKNAVDHQQSIDQFMKTNYLQFLTKPGPQHEDALNYITSPGKHFALKEAKKFYGEGSHEFGLIKAHAMKRILSSAVTPGEKPGDIQLSGAALKKTLNKYMRPHLNALFGRDTTDSLYNLSDRFSRVFSKTKNSAGTSIAAVAMITHLFSSIIPLATFGALGSFFSSETGIKLLTKGLSGDNAAIKTIDALSKTTIKEHAIEANKNTASNIMKNAVGEANQLAH